MTLQVRFSTAEEQFFFLLTNASSNLQKIVEKALRTSELSIAEYTMLRIIENTPGITAGEARKRLYATAPSIAQIIAQLEPRGLLRRVDDSDDGRRLPIFITAKGKKHLKKAKNSIAQLVRTLNLKRGHLETLSANLSLFLSTPLFHGAK